VLAVVQHQQGVPVGQRRDHRLVDAVAGLFAETERGGDRGGDHARVGGRDQVDEPDPVGVSAGHVRGHGQREPGLADTAGTGRGHLPVCRDQLGQLGPLARPADERGQRRRQDRCRVGPIGAAQLGRALGERPPVRRRQFAQHRRDMAFHGTHGDEQPRRDLGVGQVLAHQRQHLGFPGRDLLRRYHLPILTYVAVPWSPPMCGRPRPTML
jgi:hypothetical protein